MLSLRFPLSFGGFTFLMNTVFILIQIAIQRRNFPPVQLLQIAANVLFSGFIDVSMAALSWLHPAGWLARGGCMLLGCAILACGISIEIAPDVITVPGEGLVRVLAQATGKDFGRVKLVLTCRSSSSRPRCRCCFSAGCRASASARSCRR